MLRACVVICNVFFLSLKVTLNPSTSGTLNVSSGDYDEGTEVEIKVTPNSDFEFKDWTGDGSGNQNPLKVIMNSNKSITGNLNILQVQSIEIINPIDTLVISRRHKFEVKGTLSNGNNVDLTDQITLQVIDDKVTLIENNEFTVGKSGETSVNIKYNDIEISETFYVKYFEEVLNEQDDYLKQNENNTNINIPIVIINFHPTPDGVNIDPSRYNDDYFIRDRFYNYYDLDRNDCNNVDQNNPICKVGTLEMYKTRSEEIHMFTKFGIEEGSKFRGYKDNTSEKSINVQVIKYFNFYELKTKIYGNTGSPQPDYQEISDIINLESLVNDMGVKEVWFSYPPLDNVMNIWESNMSSILGDVSNSDQDQSDLPIFNNEYVVYGINIDRGPSESLHNRGHQIERQFRYIEKEKKIDLPSGV